VDWHFPVTVKDVVEMGRFGQRGWFRRIEEKDVEVVMRSLEQMGLSPLAQASISDLSGGQQQRVFLARALAQEPHILLLDEPFNGVDLTTQERVLEILNQLRRQSVTTLLATHDLNLASTKFDLVALINRKLIAFGPPAKVLCQENIQRAFGSQALLLGEMVVVDHCCPE
jgi:ABC-type Mn2+/Zn2+ transport system ATPase subunit